MQTQMMKRMTLHLTQEKSTYCRWNFVAEFDITLFYSRSAIILHSLYAEQVNTLCRLTGRATKETKHFTSQKKEE